jgi:hypothetical protein
MSKKLAAANLYLRDPAIRKRGMWISAKTSSAIEGIRQPFAVRSTEKAVRRPARRRSGATSA